MFSKQRSQLALVWWPEASKFCGGPASFNSYWTSWPAKYKTFNKFSLQLVELRLFRDCQLLETANICEFFRMNISQFLRDCNLFSLSVNFGQ